MAMENCRDVDVCITSVCDPSINGSLDIGDAMKESEEPNVGFLDDFELLVDDIEARLTVSRMVNDSFIRGSVNAVEQEAADKLAQKELEILRLKETITSMKRVVKPYVPNIEKDGALSRLSDALFEHDRTHESFGSLKDATRGQFKNLRKEIDKIRGHSSIRRINSGSDWVGLGGILQEDETREWIDVDKNLDSLSNILDTVYEQVDAIIYSYKDSLCQWLLEQEFCKEIEHMVVRNCVRGLMEQFEERLQDQDAQCYSNDSANLTEKINEISSLRQELLDISRLLSNPETGLSNSHSSLETNDDSGNNKRTDYLHRVISGEHVLPLASLSAGNGKHEESVIPSPENVDPAQLMHFDKEGLVNYFKNEMIKMKRSHDYKLQEMTEEYFSLKREYLKLKERGSSLPSKKNKEFDVLRKRIPDVIAKLDRILVESEKFPVSNNNGDTLDILKDKVELLLSENRHLRDSLSCKENEVDRLSSQVFDAIEKMSQYSLAEDNLLKKVENLESAIEDGHIESTISGDVYKCFIREAMNQISEDSEMEHNMMKEIYDLIFKDASCTLSHPSKNEIEDSDLESLIVEGLCAIVFKEAFSEAKEKVRDLSIDMFEKEKVLKSEVAEKEKLQHHAFLMASVVDEKEKLLNETMATLSREKEKLMLASQELDAVRDQTNQHQMIISKCNEESSILKVNLDQALKKLELQKVETCELRQKLDQAVNDLRESNEEKRRLLVASNEKENILSSFKKREMEQRKQIESVTFLIEGLSKAVAGFECRVAEDMRRSNLRLENLSSQSSSLIQMANILKRKGLQYKWNLERKCSDLEKAETEVDLLGDEVEVLLGLLEKIYIALDHYSPVLKHYPGIMEILKLVRRKLSGETKSV